MKLPLLLRKPLKCKEKIKRKITKSLARQKEK